MARNLSFMQINYLNAWDHLICPGWLNPLQGKRSSDLTQLLIWAFQLFSSLIYIIDLCVCTD